ncbi:MAG: NADH-quinone oxidoreductase subunit J [Planctomycetota bacterium]|nr:NADH-quinone oxidoreductase subunit J [Planctomycetota bacterium]
MADALFYVMAVAAVLAALGVVLAKNPMQCVLSLLVSFFALAVIYLLAGFQFLAAAQILVYAGAIMVLFLFVIMLLNLGSPGTEDPTDVRMFSRANATLMVVVAAAILFVLALAIRRAGPMPVENSLPEGGLDPIPGLAGEMFGRYLLPFEAISVLLLATAVAVVVLAKRDRRANEESKA